MRVRLGNDYFTAEVDSLGGEIRSLVDRATGREWLWQADPAWWKGTAPLLFPIVGGLRGGSYRHDGHEYRLPQHGFARTTEFELAAAGEASAEFRLRSSEATRAVYPFEFELRLGWTLGPRGLAHRCSVINAGRVPMLFSLGFHPAFNLPLGGTAGGGAGGTAIENHHILFEHPEGQPRHFFKDGLLIAGKTAEVFENSRVVALSRELFDEGPVVITGTVSREFSLVNGIRGESLTLRTGPVPTLALWSKPGAPFVCLEPWHGLPDSTDAGGEFRDKAGIMALEPGRAFESGYGLEIGQAQFPLPAARY